MQPARPHPTAQREGRSFPALPSLEPAALQGEKGRQDSPKEEADTANAAWGQRPPIPQLNTAQDLPSQAELPSGLSALHREGFLWPCCLPEGKGDLTRKAVAV